MAEKEPPTSISVTDLDVETPVILHDSQLNLEIKVDGGWIKRLQEVLKKHQREVTLIAAGGTVIAITGVMETLKRRRKKIKN